MPTFNKAVKTNYPALMNRPFSPDTLGSNPLPPNLCPPVFAFEGLAKKKGRCRPLRADERGSPPHQCFGSA